MISRRRFLTLTALAAGAGLIGSATQAFAIEPSFSLTLKEWHVAHHHWPAGAAPLRIGILTDIHAVEPWMPPSRIEHITDQLNAQRPDIIVLLGDYVNALNPRYYSREVPVADWMSPLASLHAPLGVYAILGNHDWSSHLYPEIRVAFEKAQIALLENDAVKIDHGHARFWLAGLRDQLAWNSRGVGDLRTALRRVPDHAPVVLLAHEPDIFDVVPERVVLTLAGHTHGGQIYIPFMGRPGFRAGNARYARYAYGHFEHQGRQMIVSSGLGLSNIPVRFLVPPEIAIVTLQSASPASQFTFNS